MNLSNQSELIAKDLTPTFTLCIRERGRNKLFWNNRKVYNIKLSAYRHQPERREKGGESEDWQCNVRRWRRQKRSRCNEIFLRLTSERSYFSCESFRNLSSPSITTFQCTIFFPLMQMQRNDTWQIQYWTCRLWSFLIVVYTWNFEKMDQFW